MVDTVGAAREDGGTRGVVVAALALAAGVTVASTLTFALFGFVGGLLPNFGYAVLAVCAAAVVGDALGLRVRPQIRAQVPESWRRAMPLPVATLLYGALLGTGLSSAVPAFASWGLVLLVVLGAVPHAALVGLALGIGRALPILAIAPLGAHLLAERPFPLRLVRLAGACALALAVSQSSALAGPSIPGPATDPSVAGADVAWEQPGAGGFLLRGGVLQQLPGHHPALGGALVAWHNDSDVTVADAATLAPRFHEAIVGVRQLAVSDSWLVLRELEPNGTWRLIAQSIADTSIHRIVAQVRAPSSLGRPSLSGSTLVYAVATTKGSSIIAVELDSGATRTVRKSSSSVLANPSALGRELLYVDTARFAQRLVLGPIDGAGGRVLLSTPPLAGQDRGRDRGHPKQGTRTPCRSSVRPTTTILWTTALGETAAYVTAIAEPRGGVAHPVIRHVAR